MSADDIGCFLPAVAYNRSFDTSARDATVGLPCKGIYRYVSSFKLLFKPVAVLLEDQGSRASCAGYHQRSFMFIAKLDCYIAGEFFATVRALFTSRSHEI